MAYKIFHGRPKVIPEKYYEEKEIKELKEKYKGHIPPATEISRIGTRNVFHVQKLVHRQGHFVYYKDNLAQIKKVEKRGIWLQVYKKDKDDFMSPFGKPVFISEKKVEHQVYPVTFPQLSIGMIAPYNLATVDE